MAIAELLEWLGLEGSIVLVVSTVGALLHGRSLLQMAATLGIYARAVGFMVLLTVLAMSGLIPGVQLQVDIAQLADLLGGLLKGVLEMA